MFDIIILGQFKRNTVQTVRSVTYLMIAESSVTPQARGLPNIKDIHLESKLLFL